jgi:exodeoxyribonuclease VII large subunit
LRRALFDQQSALEQGLKRRTQLHRRHVAQLELRLRDPRSVLRQFRQRLDVTAGELSTAIISRVRDTRRSLREPAAHLKVPAKIALEQRLRVSRLALALGQAMGSRINPSRIAVARHAAHLTEPNLVAGVTKARSHIGRLFDHLESATRSLINGQRMRLVAEAQRLDAVSPLRVLERGYAVVIKAGDGRAATDAAQIQIGDELDIRLAQGRLRARTIGRQP